MGSLDSLCQIGSWNSDVNKEKESTQTIKIEIVLDKFNNWTKKTYLSDIPSAEECIQFFTIHKAKGLEFDTVIIPSLNSTTRVV